MSWTNILPQVIPAQVFVWILFIFDSTYKTELTELWRLHNLTYFVIWWRHRCRHECVIHNLHKQKSPIIYLQKILRNACPSNIVRITISPRVKHYHLAIAGDKETHRIKILSTRCLMSWVCSYRNKESRFWLWRWCYQCDENIFVDNLCTVFPYPRWDNGSR